MRPLCSVMKTRLRGPRHSRHHWSVCPGHAPTEGASVSVPRAPSRPAVPYRLRRRPANHLLARLPAVPWLIPASGPDTLPRPAHLPAPSEYPPPGSPPGPLCTWPRCRDSLAQDRGAPFPPRRSQAASAQSTTTAPLTPSPAHPPCQCNKATLAWRQVRADAGEHGVLRAGSPEHHKIATRSALSHSLHSEEAMHREGKELAQVTQRLRGDCRVGPGSRAGLALEAS